MYVVYHYFREGRHRDAARRSVLLHDTNNNYTSLLLQVVNKDLTIHQSIIPFSIGKMQPQNIIIELYKLCLN